MFYCWHWCFLNCGSCSPTSTLQCFVNIFCNQFCTISQISFFLSKSETLLNFLFQMIAIFYKLQLKTYLYQNTKKPALRVPELMNVIINERQYELFWTELEWFVFKLILKNWELLIKFSIILHHSLTFHILLSSTPKLCGFVEITDWNYGILVVIQNHFDHEFKSCALYRRNCFSAWRALSSKDINRLIAWA